IPSTIESNACRIKSGKCTCQGRESAHWMSAFGKTNKDCFHVFIDYALIQDVSIEFLKLRSGGKFSENEQVSYFEEIGFLRQCFYGITPVFQNSLLPVKKGDGTLTRACVLITRINGNGS